MRNIQLITQWVTQTRSAVHIGQTKPSGTIKVFRNVRRQCTGHPKKWTPCREHVNLCTQKEHYLFVMQLHCL